jgi:hypothetical protein
VPSAPSASWPGYIQAGERFAADTPAGAAFMDSVAGLGNAMVRQSREQFQDSAGRGDRQSVGHHGMGLEFQAAQAGPTAGLTQLSDSRPGR